MNCLPSWIIKQLQAVNGFVCNEQKMSLGITSIIYVILGPVKVK